MQIFSKTFCGLVFALAYFTHEECYFRVIVTSNLDVGNPSLLVDNIFLCMWIAYKNNNYINSY